MLYDLVILSLFDYSFTKSVRSYAASEKALWSEDANDLSESSSMNRFFWVGFVDTKDPSPFSDPVDVFVRGSLLETKFFFWNPGWMLALLLCRNFVIFYHLVLSL